MLNSPCGCECCCCEGEDRSSWPDRLTFTATFTGVVPPSLADPLTGVLTRQVCPVHFTTQFRNAKRLIGQDQFGPIYQDYIHEHLVRCEYVSGSNGSGAMFGIGPFYYTAPFVPEAFESRTVLWMRHGGKAVVFELVHGTPLMKKTNALPACSPEFVAIIPDDFGLPTLQVVLPITTSWTAIAAAIVAGGLATECLVYWEDTLPNGWDVATLIALNQFGNPVQNLFFTSQNGVPCNPSEVGTVLSFNYKTGYVGGEAVFFSLTPYDPLTTTRYSSKYGAAIQEIHGPTVLGFPPVVITTGSTYYRNAPSTVSPSIFHATAPFTAIAIGTVAAGLFIRMEILADATDAPIHPKPFPEAIGYTACSDCSTSVTQTQPTKSGVPIANPPYNVATRVLAVDNCPPCNTAPDDFDDLNNVVATYSRKQIVDAAMRTMTVKKRFSLNILPAPQVTFVLTINGQTTAAISTTASANTVRLALEALSNVVPGDVVCTGGPLPTEILVTWQGNFETPVAITFSGARITVAALYSREDVAHFRSDEAYDANYPRRTFAITSVSSNMAQVNEDLTGRLRNGGLFKIMGSTGNDGFYHAVTITFGSPTSITTLETLPSAVANGTVVADHLTYLETTAFLDVYGDYRREYVDPVSPVDPEPPLQFPNGAFISNASCVKNYRNAPYEKIVANVKSIAYPGSPTIDVFSPADNIKSGITLPVETSGTIPPPSEISVGSGSTCVIGSGLSGGKDGLTYRANPGNGTAGGRYLSASGATYFHIKYGNDYHDFSTISDLMDFLDAWVQCNCTLLGCPDAGYFLPCNPLLNTTTCSAGGRTQNGCAITAIPCGNNPVYQTFTQPDVTCEGNLLPGQPPPPYPLPWPPGVGGAIGGVFREMEYEGYQIRSTVLNLDPCGSRIECIVDYWLTWFKRVPYTIDGSWQPATGSSASRIERHYTMYGFVEPRRAVFSAAVSTDLGLRPNIDKSRIITLAFESDTAQQIGSVVGGGPSCPVFHNGQSFSGTRGFLAGWNGWDIAPMPTPTEWTVDIWNMLTACIYPLRPPGTVLTGAQSLASCGTGAHTGTTILTNNSSHDPMIDPSSIPTPNIIDFSTSTVEVLMEPQAGAHDVTGCPTEFRYKMPAYLPAAWRNLHVLLADTNEPHWIEEVADAPFVKAILSPVDWTLTLFVADCSSPAAFSVIPLNTSSSIRHEPRRVVARYRLPCNQRNRFNFTGPNLLELISADRAVANWPETVTVYPYP